MISKKYRLAEYEFRKVLGQKKPFFSYMCTAYVKSNRTVSLRCAILLSGKCTKGSVNRNFWRRKFYDISREYHMISLDVVLVPKKGTLLDYKNPEHRIDFEKNVRFLFQKIQTSVVKK